MKADYQTLRWADLTTRGPIAIGERVRTGDIFRVEAPFPCVWKVFFAARASAPANFALTIRALFLVGVGAFTAEARQDVVFNQTYLIELPAQSLSLVYEVDPAIAIDTYQFGGTAAPMTMFKHLQVEAQRR